MSDYGHALLFGAFLTPSSGTPNDVVALTRLSEKVGLDLVTFQDHPYQPAFLDTWALISYVAAQTSSIGLSANVVNLPLRPPAVLARSLSSLDRLSGGRIELGLGAGAFWEAIEAMGGRRLYPGQAMQALDEAIDIFRGIWDGDARGGVRVDGDVYRVAGAKRGPSPAHQISIWLGAYKPRMLALTGSKADGWLPSMGYLKPDDLSAGNTIIDDAAHQAGRAPETVRRLLNVSGEFISSNGGFLVGPPAQWAQELAELTLVDGVSAFILGSDDATTLQRFAHEVAPHVRELVSAERRAARPAGLSGNLRVADAARPATPPPATPRSTVRGERSRPEGSRSSAFTLIPTPDDGTRLSTSRVWDEATRPTAPDIDPERSYTAHELASGQHLIDIHDHLRAELVELRELIDQVKRGALQVTAARSAINTMTMRQNNWTLGTYCESYCRVVTTHHTLEDQGVFPHLRRREPRLGGVLDRLEQEHRAIHDVLEVVDQGLVALVSTPDDGLAQLESAVALLSDTLLSHLAYEERELVEPLARLGLSG